MLVFVSGLSEDGATAHGMALSQWLAPAVAAYGIAVTAYATLPEATAQARDQRILKRLRGSPLPPVLYLAGRLIAAVLIGLVTFTVVVGVAVVFFEVGVNLGTLPALVVTLLLGAGCFAALGLALASVVPTAKAVPAVSLGSLLPMAFISDIFILGGQPPGWVQAIAGALPLKPFAVASAQALDPGTTGSGLALGPLAVLAAWTVLGALVAWRRFSWEPRRG